MPNWDKRAANRTMSRDALAHDKIEFEVFNNGAHLILEGPNGKIDFWPGTGKWIDRATKKEERGVFHLIAYVQGKVG